MTNRYTLTEALAIVVDQIDGEDPNTDVYAGLLDPLRQLLEDLIPLAESAKTAEFQYSVESIGLLEDLAGCLEADKSEDDLAEVMGYEGQAEPVELDGLTNDGLAAILEAHRDRIIVWNPATKCLDGCVSVSINGACVQLTVEQETPASGDFMVASFNATQAARDLIEEAQNDTDEINTPEAGGEMHLDEMISHRLEDLEQETMGTASRIGDEAWTYYHATKSEVSRLQQFPEEEDPSGGLADAALSSNPVQVGDEWEVPEEEEGGQA
jgi:hypothetical protein